MQIPCYSDLLQRFSNERLIWESPFPISAVGLPQLLNKPTRCAQMFGWISPRLPPGRSPTGGMHTTSTGTMGIFHVKKFVERMLIGGRASHIRRSFEKRCSIGWAAKFSATRRQGLKARPSDAGTGGIESNIPMLLKILVYYLRGFRYYIYAKSVPHPRAKFRHCRPRERHLF